jgi:hypothetical protein
MQAVAVHGMLTSVPLAVMEEAALALQQMAVQVKQELVVGVVVQDKHIQVVQVDQVSLLYPY